jgi:transcriptional regulator GlxA family with amidase domain
MRPAVTESERLVCGGAHATFLLQAVRVLKHFTGPAIAQQCARSMLIDLTQTTQTPLQPLIGEQSHNDALVHKAQRWLQDHMTDCVRISDLARQLAVSERTLIRRFNAAQGHSPLTYLQHLRIDTARALLEVGDLSVERIAVYVGYTDTSSFTRLFRARMGLTPGTYRARFQLHDPS